MKLLLIRRGDYEEHQIEHARLMQRPNDLIMQTGIVIRSTLGLRIGWHLEHIAHQDQDAFNQQILLLAAYGKCLKRETNKRWGKYIKSQNNKENVLRQIPVLESKQQIPRVNLK